MEDKKASKPGMKKFILSAVFLLALMLSFIFDSQIALLLSKIRNPILDFFMIAVSISSVYIILVVPTLFLFFSDKKQILKYWFGFALTFFVMLLIKMVIHRERPFQALDLTVPASLISASYSAWDFSFPSNHSALSFIALPFLKGNFFIIWLAVSILIVVSRVYFGLHYLGDVLAGMALSYLVSIFVMRYIK